MANNKLDNKHLREQLIKIGVEGVTFLKRLLSDNDKIATGELINSLDYDIVSRTNSLFLEILTSPHFKYVDEGRKKGAKMPPIKPIVSWLKAKHIRGRDKKGRFISQESTAWLISKSISLNGIKPLNAKKKLIREVFDKRKQIIVKAVGQDIQDLLNRIFYKKT